MSDTDKGKAKSPCCNAPVEERAYRSLLLQRVIYNCSACGATLKWERASQ